MSERTEGGTAGRGWLFDLLGRWRRSNNARPADPPASNEDSAEGLRLFYEARAARAREDPQAITLLRACLAMQERVLHEDDPLLAQTRNELGLALKEAGALREACELFLKAHAYFVRCHGEDHPDYANTLHNYGATLQQLGEDEDGELQLRQALRIRERLNNAELLGRALSERARGGETTGVQVAAILRDLASALAGERKPLAALGARRNAVRAYFGWHLESSVSALHALQQAYMELRCGLLSKLEAIDLGVELVREGGPMAGDESLMTLACLDHREADDLSRAPVALESALEAHTPGWRRESGGHEAGQYVLDLAVQRFLGKPEAAPAIGILIGIVRTLHEELGWQTWLEYFWAGGSLGKALEFDGSDPAQLAVLREACTTYLADRARAFDPLLNAEACERMTRRRARREALNEAQDAFARGQQALQAGRPGAETGLRSAVAVFERELPDSSWTATAQNELGLALKAKGKLKDAVLLLRKAHEHFAQRHGEAHRDTAITMHNLGATLNELGDVEAGGLLLQRALELQLHHRYTTMVDIANNYETLGENLYARGRLPEARDMLEKALALREEGHRRQETDIADSCAQLCQVAQALGDHAAAERLARRILEVRSHALGHFHRDTADALNELGVCLQRQGRLEEAEQCLRQALGRLQDQGGRHDPFSINARINLAEVLLQQMNPHEAFQVITEAVQLCESALETGHEYTARALTVLGETYRVLRRYTEAVPILARARELHERRFGRDHVKTAYCANTLGLVFERCGALEEAERMLLQAEHTFAARLGAEHPDRLTAKCNRANVIIQRGDARQAETLWQEVLQCAPHGEAAYRLAESLRARGETAAAEARYLQAIDIYERTRGPASWYVAWVGEALGRLHWKSGNAAAAEEWFRRAWTIFVQLYGPVHEDTNRALAAWIWAVAARDLDAAIGLANGSISDITDQSHEAQVAAVQRAVQLANLLRRANRLPEAAHWLSTVLEERSAAFSFDSPLAVSAALDLAEVQRSLGDVGAGLRTLQLALARCDDEENADEGAAARISGTLAGELLAVGRTGDAALAAERAWLFYRGIENQAQAAARSYAIYWRTKRAAQFAHLKFWHPKSGQSRQTGWWLLRIDLEPKGDELAAIIEALVAFPVAQVRLITTSEQDLRFLQTTERGTVCVATDAPDTRLECTASSVAIGEALSSSLDSIAWQSDLVCALAQYPRVRWRHWALYRVEAGESLVLQGTDSAELIATWQ